MNAIHDWILRWQISPAAMADLTAALTAHEPNDAPADRSEAGVQSRARLRISQLGMRAWRNNVGAVHDGRTHIRFGLANDSPQMNDLIKSGDLIGIRPRVIQPGDVGSLIGQFASWEIKHAGWRPRPNDEHEQAQLRWAALVESLGGYARFGVTNESQV